MILVTVINIYIYIKSGSTCEEAAMLCIYSSSEGGSALTSQQYPDTDRSSKCDAEEPKTKNKKTHWAFN